MTPYVADALRPHVLVELDVNAHVRGLHHLRGELLDLQRGERGERREERWKEASAKNKQGSISKTQKHKFQQIIAGNAVPLTHRRHRAGRPLLEGDPVDRLGEVDGVLASHDILSLPHGA